MSRRIARFATGSECHQQLAVGAKLEDSVTFASRCRVLFEFARIRSSCINYPHVAVGVYVHTMRPYNEVGAEALYHIALRVELNDRIDTRRCTGIRATTVAGPYVDAIDVDIHSTYRSPVAAVGQSTEVALRLIRIRQMIHGLLVCMLGRLHCTALR